MHYPYPEVILFDLGGVLVDWDGIRPLIELSRRTLVWEDVRRFWLESPWVRAFESGACTPQAFAAGVIAQLDLATSPEDFLERFISWDRGPLPGAVELVNALSRRFVLACLSNNNALHWQQLHGEAGLGRQFQYGYSSHEIGHVKPDREVFEYVLADLGCPAEKLLFLDDNPECVRAARSLGLHAHVARGVVGVRDVLKTLNLDL